MAACHKDGNFGGSLVGVTRSEKIAELVAKQLVADIVERGFEPGAILPSEMAMLQRYGVGRASLREALRILEVHGVIRVRPGPGGGPVVASVGPRDFGRAASLHLEAHGASLSDVIEARLSMEPMMARLAAVRISPPAKDELAALLVEGRLLVDEQGAAWARASAAFHDHVAQCADNSVLALLSCSLSAIQNDRIHVIFPAGGRADVVAAHDRIAQAIVSGDGDRAELYMRRHIEALRSRLMELLPAVLTQRIRWG